MLLKPSGAPVPCTFCFSIRRDIMDLPSLVIGVCSLSLVSTIALDLTSYVIYRTMAAPAMITLYRSPGYPLYRCSRRQTSYTILFIIPHALPLLVPSNLVTTSLHPASLNILYFASAFFTRFLQPFFSLSLSLSLMLCILSVVALVSCFRRTLLPS